MYLHVVRMGFFLSAVIGSLHVTVTITIGFASTVVKMLPDCA